MTQTKEHQLESNRLTAELLTKFGIELTVDDAWGWIKEYTCNTPYCAQKIHQWNKRKMARWYNDNELEIPEHKWGRFVLCHVCAARFWSDELERRRKKRMNGIGEGK